MTAQRADGTGGGMRPRVRTLLRFLAGAGVGFGVVVFTILVGTAWFGVPAMLVGVAAVFAVVHADRSGVLALGSLAGAALVFVLMLTAWTYGSGCADEAPDGRVVEVDCRTGLPVNRWSPPKTR